MRRLAIALILVAGAAGADEAAPSRFTVELENDPGMTFSRALPWRIAFHESGPIERTGGAPPTQPDVLAGEAAHLKALFAREGFGRLRPRYGTCPYDFPWRRISVVLDGWTHEVWLCSGADSDETPAKDLALFLRTWYGVLHILSPTGVVEMDPWDQAILEGERR